jgi:hypothetical protein
LPFAVALNVKFKVPAEFGVPDIAPVAEFKVNPAVDKTVPPVSE